ncbi:30S ribosomal protein S18 [Candidatus Saganbacteria bacterium]|uniref:Small ribosomal subunit protein bS18 n=1 Tax=Candidatus Saganbacteria bacterium TaxID=2575572 RepID=A0A9D6ULU3_UNCSA|nr:30S ribosomal protein S18 [Candidatus Saganbacteria bacterium]
MTREPRKPKQSQFKRVRRRPCVFCIDQKKLDYKDLSFVRRFVTDRGKIAPRRMSGCCALHQRMVSRAVKRARQIGLVPYVIE